ncbi:MAG: hypothetical protein R6U44_05965 [Archaeoglobaceae archaeon]
MKPITSKIGCMLLFILLVGSVSTIAADSPPQLPMLIYGEVTDGADPAPTGTVVMVKVNDEVVNQADVNGDSWYGVPSDNRLIIEECDSFELIVNVNGDNYSFGDYEWEPSISGSEKIDLNYSGLTPITTPTPTPTPTEEPSPTPTPTEEPSPTPTPTEEPNPTPTPTPTEESSPPQLPMLIHGRVTNDTEPAPAGSTVTVNVDSEVVAQGDVNSSGWYGAPDNLIIEECDLFNLMVDVNGFIYDFGDYEWESGDSGPKRIDLDYSGLTPVSTPTPTPTPSPNATSPEIISWSNTYTEDSSLELTIERLSDVEFNVTANQSVNWEWSGDVEQSGDGESQATATRSFPNTGLVEVSVRGTNSNGSTQVIQWNCSVEDTTPPASITNLTSASTEETLNWTWTNPSDDDFSQIMVYINGEQVANTSAEYFQATNLTPQTSYTISTHTVDDYGNVNYSWVNNTASTNETSAPTTSGGGGGGGGGSFTFNTPTPEPSPTPTETSESGVQAGTGETRTSTPETKEETPIDTVEETPTETPPPTTTDQGVLPWWQQPTAYIGLIALVLGAIIITVYMAKRPGK